MNPHDEEKDPMYRAAERRAAAKLGFLIHLSVYILVNFLLIVINQTTSPQYYWFKWPLLGWGIGVIMHAVGVFIFTGGAGIRQWLIQRELDKMKAPKE
ncbi:MAG: hypothetical protein C4519_28375 [Desulfobacteraceae bacterium]|nr:MAG: hypothetical protein C4519_28375 [Desulfobacteraceae bacterium]